MIPVGVYVPGCLEVAESVVGIFLGPAVAFRVAA